MPRLYPPGPPNGWIGYQHLQNMRRDLLGFMVELQRQYGDCAYFRVGPMRVYQFTHPEQVREVLVSQNKSLRKTDRLRQVLGRWNGNGILLNEGKPWQRQRRLVQKAFHPRILNTYAQMMVRHALELVDRCQQKEVNIAHELSRLTLGAVAEALFGAEVRDIAEEFRRQVDFLQTAAGEDFVATWVTPTWFPTARRRRLRQAMKFLDDYVMNLIAERRMRSARKGQLHGDLLSLLLQAVDEEGDGSGMTDRQARDESVGLLLGGNETTAVALTWAMYLLAQHPHEQQKVMEEIDHTLSGSLPTAQDAERLVRTERAFKEAMRLFPPVYATARQAMETVQIGGYWIPRGAMVQVATYITHRDPRWFDDPEQFRPDRFAGDFEKQLPSCAYYPFGAGPRACVGKGFAMIEGVLALATILSRSRLHLAAGQREVQLESQVSLHPRGGVRLRFEPRGGEHAVESAPSASVKTLA